LDLPGDIRCQFAGAFGDAGNNSLRAPRLFDLDANLLNYTNFHAPTATLSSSTFGKILSAGDPRTLQLAAKFRF
jgi:hypothetical protein